MAQNLIVRLKNQIYAAWKFCRAAHKSEWELSDYPVVTLEAKINAEYIGTRYKQHQYSATIVNWWTLSGFGDTKAEALQDLEKCFVAQKLERAKSGRVLPRPGTRVPIEFASQKRVSRHPELARDLLRRILEVEGAWISDESSLWDFHALETNDELIVKIKEVYGVDVFDIHSARLCEILERIAAVRQSTGLRHD